MSYSFSSVENSCVLKFLPIQLVWQGKMESVRNEEDIAFNELMQEVHQQFLCYKEKSSKRFEKLEELVDLAAQKMSILKEMKAKSREEGFVNPFVWKTEEHGNLRPSGRTTHQSLQKFKLNVPEFEDEPQDAYAILKDFQKSGPSTTNGAQLEALFNEEEWSDMDSEVSITSEKEKAVYDELLGEDKEDWHSEEIICKALGLEDFFEPKQNLEEGNSIGGKVLECISYSWQPYPSVSPVAVVYVPRQEHEELGSVRNLSIGQFKLFGVNNLFDCSLETKLLDKSTKRKIVLVAEKEIGDELNKSITRAMEESKEESDTKLWFSGIVPGHGDIPKFVGSYKVEDKQGVNEAVFSKRTINMGGIDEAFLDKMTTKYFPIADNSYSLNKKSSNIGEKNVFTFDPGGYVQNDQSKCVTKKLVEAVLIIPVDGELRHLKDIHLKFLAIDKEHSQFRRKVYVFLFVNSKRHTRPGCSECWWRD